MAEVCFHHFVHFGSVETFADTVENSARNILQEKKEFPTNNLSKSNKAAIDYFTKRVNIVLTKADNEGATVIMEVEEYISKANQQLKDENF